MAVGRPQRVTPPLLGQPETAVCVCSAPLAHGIAADTGTPPRRSAVLALVPASGHHGACGRAHIRAVAVYVCTVSLLRHNLTPVFPQVRSPGCLAVGASEALVIPA